VSYLRVAEGLLGRLMRQPDGGGAMSGTPAETLEELAGKEGAQLVVIGSLTMSSSR
jgi:hypothetical protein